MKSVEPTATCHVVTHVHWDREWYRPFEAFRARLVELAAHVCDQLGDGRLRSFHLDGQTTVLADVADIRPDLAARLRTHAADGRLTIGPWHVLADNQLVSGENLIRNLLAARRHAGATPLSRIGYSPDAFGHPADLPRILAGFGMDTALVWRGAPPAHARFRWRSPDGSEVFAVNQGYHAAEVLWPPQSTADPAVDVRVKDFVRTERDRLPEGPWLLLNGGDHLAPGDSAARIAAAAPAAAAEGAELVDSGLEGFFADARAAAGELPLVEGELRYPGDRLTFLLPGTLSARTYLKQANAAAQTLLERWAEPMVALHAAHDASAPAELRHAWELLLSNAPHDSICGCSVDAVHRENQVRYERVSQTGEHLLTRALAASGLDTRLYGDRPAETARLAVLNPHPAVHSGPVTADLLTAPDRHPVEVLTPGGASVPFECETLGAETAFEADLDLLPDSRPSLRHRLRLLARDVPPLGRTVYHVRLGAAPAPAAALRHDAGADRFTTGDGTEVAAAPDASLTLRLPGGDTLTGFGRLVDGGDRGDTYNYDPPHEDLLVTPRLRTVRRLDSPVRTGLELTAELTVPRHLASDRTARAADTVTLPLTLHVTSWHGDPPGLLHWQAELDNTASDHRLRMHFPTTRGTGTWTGDGHYSLIERPVGTDLGPLPDDPAREAVCGAAPVQSASAIGAGAQRVAVVASGLPEMRGLPGGEPGHEELVLTLLRSVGWLSRFDLRSRTTGAGPMLPTPEAQCHGGHTFTLTTAVGGPATTDLGFAHLAAHHRAPLRAWQLRPGTGAGPKAPGLAVDGALLTALKPAEDGKGMILRVSNPTGSPLPTRIELAAGYTVTHCRLDEQPLDAAGQPGQPGRLTWTMKPYELATLRLELSAGL
ncbi:glycosyl hydrolase-related protein [Streptomyces sp. MAR4 CNY-716]